MIKEVAQIFAEFLVAAWAASFLVVGVLIVCHELADRYLDWRARWRRRRG